MLGLMGMLKYKIKIVFLVTMYLTPDILEVCLFTPKNYKFEIRLFIEGNWFLALTVEKGMDT